MEKYWPSSKSVSLHADSVSCSYSEAVDMKGRFQMQGGKNWILPKDLNANRFFQDSHWLEIQSNHLCPSMGPNGGSVAIYGLCSLLINYHMLPHVTSFTTCHRTKIKGKSTTLFSCRIICTPTRHHVGQKRPTLHATQREERPREREGGNNHS